MKDLLVYWLADLTLTLTLLSGPSKPRVVSGCAVGVRKLLISYY